MKKVFIIFAGILALSANAKAQDNSDADSIKRCVGVMLGNPKMTQEKAEYACANPYLDPREGDSSEQENMRQDLAEDAQLAKEDMLRHQVEMNE